MAAAASSRSLAAACAAASCSFDDACTAQSCAAASACVAATCAAASASRCAAAADSLSMRRALSADNASAATAAAHWLSAPRITWASEATRETTPRRAPSAVTTPRSVNVNASQAAALAASTDLTAVSFAAASLHVCSAPLSRVASHADTAPSPLPWTRAWSATRGAAVPRAWSCAVPKFGIACCSRMSDATRSAGTSVGGGAVDRKAAADCRGTAVGERTSDAAATSDGGDVWHPASDGVGGGGGGEPSFGVIGRTSKTEPGGGVNVVGRAARNGEIGLSCAEFGGGGGASRLRKKVEIGPAGLGLAWRRRSARYRSLSGEDVEPVLTGSSAPSPAGGEEPVSVVTVVVDGRGRRPVSLDVHHSDVWLDAVRLCARRHASPERAAAAAAAGASRSLARWAVVADQTATARLSERWS